jgi:hypothetical protein
VTNPIDSLLEELSQIQKPPSPGHDDAERGEETTLPAVNASEPVRETLYHRITAYITNDHSPPTHFVVCPVCGGRVIFNLAELRDRSGAKSVCCAGSETPTNGGQDPHNHWHPSNALTDAGEIFPYPWG